MSIVYLGDQMTVVDPPPVLLQAYQITCIFHFAVFKNVVYQKTGKQEVQYTWPPDRPLINHFLKNT